MFLRICRKFFVHVLVTAGSSFTILGSSPSTLSQLDLVQVHLLGHYFTSAKLIFGVGFFLRETCLVICLQQFFAQICAK